MKWAGDGDEEKTMERMRRHGVGGKKKRKEKRSNDGRDD